MKILRFDVKGMKRTLRLTNRQFDTILESFTVVGARAAAECCLCVEAEEKKLTIFSSCDVCRFGRATDCKCIEFGPVRKAMVAQTRVEGGSDTQSDRRVLKNFRRCLRSAVVSEVQK